ncbi:RIPOR family member 3 isoform X1 [Mus caroli]|uniref:RIPOR family member 3 isoform X1 n=1 Tax=Mus caroli TaxID=10089 RepID=A0A6P7QQT2_MUSCR|nr:RIPOR family member 3 isoform X1 [Mus caroli]XP_029330611.1 RIPOR family member 3 isoform X1 [Mus caroli]XP_029330612.1 RIPOR family member 3 isoform X1 [Mus caroli]
MSVRLRFLSQGDAGAVGTVGRSASFAGFSSAQSRRLSKSINRNSVRSRLPAKSPKAYRTLRKGSPLCLDPRPQQVKKIFDALKRGLRDHLCEQQAELDYLCGRHTDTQRGSRLAFYYDLDKQLRLVERHIRKVEFHISKVDELYEGYCIQWRLRDGASNMQRAFSNSTQSRASRESLQELGRSLQECLEDMCLIEGTLEGHLGEFHVKMKGLVGYARLCPGDQYEVLMRLGRQRWRLKGRIEPDDSQTWDEEERVFVPSVHENLEIKVTELRGLSSMVVGAVTCDVADFFTARPQLVVVDITELGTIKLQLELLWNPLDSECRLVSPSPTGRFSMGSRKGSLYTWTPPSTPSFRDKYYLSLLQQPVQQALLLGGPRATSILGYLSDSELQGPRLRSRSQELLEMDSFSSEDPRDTETSTSASTSDVGFLPVPVGSAACTEEETREGPPPLGLLPGLAHPAGGVLVERPGWRDLGGERLAQLQDAPIHSPMVPRSRKGQEDGDVGDGVEGPVQEVLDLLRSADPAQPQLRELEYQVLGLRERLKPRGVQSEPVSAQSLMDCILESFAFLNADLASDELSLFGGSQAPERGQSPPYPLSQWSHSEIPSALPSQVWRDSPPPPRPSLKVSPSELTAGAPELDTLLTVHLQVCKALLQKLASPNLSRMVEDCLLEEAVQQRQVLEVLSDLDLEQVSKARSVEEIIPQASHRKGGLALWQGCTQPGGVLACPASTLLSQLKKTFLHRVRGKYPGQLEIVCRRLLEQVVGCGGLLVPAGLQEEQVVTWFQFHSYLQRQSISDLEKHLAQLTKEVTLIEELSCAGPAKALRKLHGKCLSQLQPLPQTLQAWALLQLDGPPRLCRAARTRLASAARNKRFREKALLYYTNALNDSDAKVQQAACVALQQLGGIESFEQIVTLCQSDLEAVRIAAREATLSFGEKGRLAFEKMDKLHLEQEAFCQEADVEITIF